MLTIGVGLAIKQDPALFTRWRNGEEVKFGARDWLAARPERTRLDGLVAPTAVFNREVSRAWLPRLHKRLSRYAHSRGGMNNLDFWESNGPFHVWGLLDRIIAETKETMVLGMILLRLGWPDFTFNLEAQDVISHPDQSWFDVAPAVQEFLK